jgi:hypothetical protein
MESKLKHLEMIQAVINRMASNSFLLKGWSVTLVSALLALAAANSDRRFVFVAALPLLMFWLLDAYFLRQERLFRKLYDKVRTLDGSAIDFSMNTAPHVKETASWIGVMFSRTLLIFYGALAIGVVIIALLPTP